jgi:hypothetical protein
VPAVPEKFDVGFEGVVTVPPAPLIILHAPVPTEAVLAASVTFVNPQVAVFVWSGPALDAVANALLVNITSSNDAGQLPFVIVHLNVALVPAGIPVTVVFLNDGVVMVAVPLTKVHKPVPVVGLLPFNVKLPLLHCVWSVLALATVGDALFVSVTLLADEHAPLVIVHVNVAVVPTGTPVTPDVGEDAVVIVAVPIVTVHKPVPTDGVLPASVKLPLLQLLRFVPAFEIVAGALLVNITSSKDAVHGLFEIVHLNVALVPAGTPVTADVGDVLVVIVAVPVTTVHNPVPIAGVFPASVKFPLLQIVWSGPAAAVVGLRLNVMTTSSVDAVQGAFEMVHLKVYVVPAVPLNVDVGLAAFPKLPPAPLTILHAPVPAAAVLAASVTVVSPHVAAPVWSGPALAVVGVALFVSITSSVVAVHTPLEIVHLNVALAPAATPVIPETGEDGVVIVAVPLTMLHKPVPLIGVLPANVKFPLLQLVWSAPAFAVVGIVLTVTASMLAALVPHPLVAVTVILPDVELAVALILLVVLVPVQPPGKVHV